MNECLPLVKQSHAEVLILLSNKDINNEISTNINANNSKYYFNNRN